MKVLDDLKNSIESAQKLVVLTQEEKDRIKKRGSEINKGSVVRE